MKTINKVKGKYSHTISDESKKDGRFTIPVIDVRDGAEARKKAAEFIKSSNDAHGDGNGLNQRQKRKRAAQMRG